MTRPDDTSSQAVALDPELVAFVLEAGLLPATGGVSMVPLTGGVASDIWKVRAPERDFVVKRALSRLRVAREWNAPVSRNANEVSWLLEAGRLVPGAVPKILAHDPGRGAFAMDYLEPSDHPVWKEELRRGHVDVSFAARVGSTIATIHGRTARSDKIRDRFSNNDTFHALRLEPYLEFTATVHPGLAGPLMSLSADTLRAKLALVHGDISPKNILAGPGGPVILDAECAWYGEPAFDLAFCLNHLLLKCFLAPAARDKLLESFTAMRAAYLARVDWEAPADIERRTARLLPALLLARVDGKSPVEYVAPAQADLVRRVAVPLVADPPDDLAQIASSWTTELEA